MWSDSKNYPYQSGRLFLGHDNTQEVGLETERHALTIAGVGKGACVIIPNLLRWPHNALVIDPKGEAAEATAETQEAMGQAVHVLDPFDSARVPDRFKACYNPPDELDPERVRSTRPSRLRLDGCSGMDQASLSEWRSEALGKISPCLLLCEVKLIRVR